MPVTISGSGPVTGLTSVASPTTLNGLTIPTLGFGKVLQVVQGTTTLSTANNTSTYADTNLSATITPSSSSSKVLVLVNQAGCLKKGGNSGNGIHLQLLRGSTSICEFAKYAGYTASSSDLQIGNISTAYLDSPATTSATTYKTQFKNNVNATGVTVQDGYDTSTMILIEVGP